MENYRNIGNTIYLGEEEFSRIFARCRAAIGIIVLKGNKRERKNSRRIDSLNTVSFRSSFSIKMVKGLSAWKETESLRFCAIESIMGRIARGTEEAGRRGGRGGVRGKKESKRVREIWNMSTEMQIFVRKLITRINSSQNVQTVCQTGRFYLFSRRQTELLRSARSSECVVACARVLPRNAVVCACACRGLSPLVRVLRRIGIKFTRHPDILFRPTDCKRIL